MKECDKALEKQVHICPLLMRTVIFESGKCTEACGEPACPVLELLDREKPQ